MNQLLNDCLNQVNPETRAEVRRIMDKITLMGSLRSEEAKSFVKEMQDEFADMGLDTDKAKIELFWEAIMDAYDEARNKTIDKACKWIDKQWDYITEERRSEIKEMFRKAMEE